jgi:hypothetical protein
VLSPNGKEREPRLGQRGIEPSLREFNQMIDVILLEGAQRNHV